MTLEITTSLKGSPSPDTSSREMNQQCDLARPISTPSTTDIAFRMVDLDNRTHRIVSHRIASRRCTRGSKCGTQDGSRDFLGISHVFASPMRWTEKKSTLKFFLSSTLWPSLPPIQGASVKSSLPSLSDVSSHRSSFPRSRFYIFLSTCYSISLSPCFPFTSLFISQSFIFYHSHKYIYTYTHIRTPSPLRFSSRYRFMF